MYDNSPSERALVDGIDYPKKGRGKRKREKKAKTIPKYIASNGWQHSRRFTIIESISDRTETVRYLAVIVVDVLSMPFVRYIQTPDDLIVSFSIPFIFMFYKIS